MDPRTARIRASRRLGSVRLDPVRRVSIRPIDEFDRSALFDFYARLSPESMRRRFLSYALPTATDLDRLAIGEGLVGILGAPGASDGAIVAHAVICPDGHGAAEVAFAVADELQGHGIGRALVIATVDQARRGGLTRLTASTLPENRAMRRLIIDAGCRVESDRVIAGVEEIALTLVSDASPVVAPAR
jgi:RimJ/RimL family protein N-acetyltransferase